MTPPSVIIHERVANWARQLRPRFRDRPIRWSETRSQPSLVRAAARSNCPILVMELDDRPSRGLEDLDAALQVAPTALSLVIDPRGRDDVASMARELGATLVLGGVVVPPEVERLLQRWLPLAGRRAESEGWSPSSGPEPEPWERPELFDSTRLPGPPDDEPN